MDTEELREMLIGFSKCPRLRDDPEWMENMRRKWQVSFDSWYFAGIEGDCSSSSSDEGAVGEEAEGVTDEFDDATTLHFSARSHPEQEEEEEEHVGDEEVHPQPKRVRLNKKQSP